MRRLRLTLAVYVLASLVAACDVLPADAAEQRSPLGNWLTESGHGVIAIERCGEALCGRIVGIDRDPGTSMPTDVHGQPQCGLTIISGEYAQDDGTWLGAVTDPRSGSTYHAKLWVGDDGNVRLRGYLGIPLLGETQVWHRFTGRLTGDCGMQ